jgi:hypothetical protein
MLMAEILGNNQGNSFATTHFGDAYLSGKYLGEIFYCCLLGLISGLISRYSMNSQSTPFAVFIGAALYWNVTSLEADVFSEFAGFLKLWLMLLVVAWIAFAPDTDKKQRQPNNRKDSLRPRDVPHRF